MPEGDRMDLGEHDYSIERCVECGAQEHLDVPGACRQCGSMEDPETVKVVPREQLAGAVEALAKLSGDWKSFYDGNVAEWERTHDEPLTLGNYVREALRRARGQ